MLEALRVAALEDIVGEVLEAPRRPLGRVALWAASNKTQSTLRSAEERSEALRLLISQCLRERTVRTTCGQLYSVFKRYALRAIRVEFLPPVQQALQLHVFDAFDVALHCDLLSDLLDALRALPNLPEHVQAVLPYARPQTKPIRIFGHRFDPVVHPENTVEAFWHALKELRVDGMEVDVCLTADDHLVCTHDRMPPSILAGGDSLYTKIRELGLEVILYADKAFLATTVVLGEGHKPTEQLSLKEIRETRRLVRLSSREHLPHEIPTLDQIAKHMESHVAQGNPQPELWVDLKVPGDDAALDRVARLLNDIFKNLDPSRVIIGNGSVAVIDSLKKRLLHRGFRFSADDAMIGPWEKAVDHQGAKQNVQSQSPNKVMDLGRVFFGPDEEFLIGARMAADCVADAQAANNNSLELCFWTINEEIILRKLLGLRNGDVAFHFLITDNVDMTRTTMKKANIQYEKEK